MDSNVIGNVTFLYKEKRGYPQPLASKGKKSFSGS
jgi:hypothetical protein